MHSDGIHVLRTIGSIVTCSCCIILEIHPIIVSLLPDLEFSNCEDALVLKERCIVMATMSCGRSIVLLLVRVVLYLRYIPIIVSLLLDFGL